MSGATCDGESRSGVLLNFHVRIISRALQDRRESAQDEVRYMRRMMQKGGFAEKDFAEKSQKKSSLSLSSLTAKVASWVSNKMLNKMLPKSEGDEDEEGPDALDLQIDMGTALNYAKQETAISIVVQYEDWAEALDPVVTKGPVATKDPEFLAVGFVSSRKIFRGPGPENVCN